LRTDGVQIKEALTLFCPPMDLGQAPPLPFMAVSRACSEFYEGVYTVR
jgi:hypothetical protein